MQHPLTVTTPLLYEENVVCETCEQPGSLFTSLGVVFQVPVIRVSCETHGVICQFPLAAGAFAYRSPVSEASELCESD